MFYLFDNKENLIQIVPKSSVIEAYKTENLGTADVLNIQIVGEENTDAVYIAHKNSNNEVSFYHIQNSKVVGSKWSITAIEYAYEELSTDGIVKDLRPNEQPLVSVLDNILNGSRWQTGTVYVSRKITTNFYYLPRLEALNKIKELTGLEFDFRIDSDGHKVTGRYVDVYEQLGADRGKRFVHGSNLLQVVREGDNSSIYTALIGRGKGEEIFDEDGESTGGYGRKISFADVLWEKSKGDPVDKPLGQDYVEIPEMTQVFGLSNGKPKIGVVEFSDIEDKEELLKATYSELLRVSKPQITYKADVLDVGDTGLGDTVSIIRKDIGIMYKVRIIKREVNLLDTRDVKIELGDKKDSFQKQQQKQIESIKETIEKGDINVKVNVNTAEIINEILKQGIDSYFGEDGYNYDLRVDNEYNLPAGVYSFDKPIDQNPTKFIYMGAGKLVISDGKNPDGTWKLKTIMDGSGLATGTVGAKQILSGSITVDLLDSDVLNAEHITIGAKGAQESLDQFLQNSQKIAIENYRNALDEIATAEANAKQYADEEFQKQLTQIEADFEENLLQIENVANNAQVNSSQLRWYIDQIKDNLNSQIDGIRNGTVDIGESLLEINSQISELERALQEAEVPQDVIDRIIQEAKTNAKSVANAAEANAKSYARAEAKAAKEYADNGIAELRNYFTRENQKTLANVENVQRQIESLTSTQNDIDRILAENESKLGEISKALDEFDPTDFEGLVSSEDFYIAKNEFENATEEYNRILSSQFATNEETQDALNRLENSRDELTDSLQNFLDELSGISEQLDEVRRVIYTDDKGRLNVSKPGSEAHLTLDNDELSIRNNNDDRLAYFGADKMYIPTAQVNDRLYLGGRYYILIDSDGSFSINWI